MPVGTGIEIKAETIGHALVDNNLAVPRNQRSYAWEKEHVQELFQDLSSAMRSERREYFLGSIIVTQAPDGRPQVVDGQQRLATATVLLAAVRDYFHSQGDNERVTTLERDYLFSYDLKTNERIPRLRLNEQDHDYFEKRVLSRPDAPERGISASRESHERIDTAARLAAEHVKAVLAPVHETERDNHLIEWVDFLKRDVRIIWVAVPDDADAYLMFETLNDRGLELSKADLLKNYLFGRGQDRMAEVQQRWYAMTGSIETVGPEELVVTYVRHLWSSMHGLTRERDLYVEIKKHVKSKQQVVDFAIELAENAALYAAIFNPSHAYWNQLSMSARRNIATLQLLRIEQVRPLLLAILKCFQPSETQRSLKLLVCSSVRFLIVGGLGSGTLESHYAAMAREVRQGAITSSDKLLARLKVVVPRDEEFRGQFATARVSRAYLARYYLRTLESQARGDPEPHFLPNEDEVISLEHVLPQSPSKAWGHIEPEVAETYYRRIGNLALLKTTLNADLGNAGFEAKKPHYQESGYILTKALSAYKAWGQDEINKRQQDLAALAVKAWPLALGS